jgi:3-deoxy-D-manno-octulosonic-acid transferase
MYRLVHTLYLLGIRLYSIVTYLISPIYIKARKRYKGVQEWQAALSSFTGQDTIWMHCASLGEFEQGRPLLDALAKLYPNRSIVLSFFSPSGFEVRKHYGNASKVVYLPADTVANARKFLDIIQPKLVIFVKYDLWYEYLHEVKRRRIPAILIAAKFHENQVYFNYGLKSFYISILECFSFIFTQDDETWNFLDSLSLKGVQIKKAGDPRFDRVIEQVSKPAALPDLSDFLEGQFCFIAGSTWPKDDEIIIQTLKSLKDHSIKWIIAPHEYSEDILNKYRKQFKHELVLLSEIHQLHPGHKIIMIDTVGYLSTMYGQAQMAYIGGGQHHRIHNIQEPAAHGIPICFGARHTDFKEATDLLQAGGARVVYDSKSLIMYIHEMKQNTEKRFKAGQINRSYIVSKSGATNRILSTLETAGDL